MADHPYAPQQYAKIKATFTGESMPRTVLIEIQRDTDRAVTGFVVGKDGSRVERQIPGGWAREFVAVDRGDILKLTRMRLNLHYGELENE